MEALSFNKIYNVLMKKEIYKGVYLGRNSPVKTNLPYSILLLKPENTSEFLIYRFRHFGLEGENIVLKHPYPVEPKEWETNYYKNLLEKKLSKNL